MRRRALAFIKQHALLGVDRDHALGHAGQDRPPARRGAARSLSDALLELLGHAVQRARQDARLLRTAGRDAPVRARRR
jgi:hypothetical protein